MTDKHTVIDLFSGCGGFSYGFQQAGYHVIIGVDNVLQLKIHLESLNKKINPSIFKEALSICYDNENTLNPSLWPISS